MRSTIAVFSSSRRHGNTGQFIDRVSGALGIETIDLATLNLTPYDYLHRNRGDDFEPLMRQVLRHEQIIFATPIYWYAVSPAMKILLDRISDLLELPDLLETGRRLRGRTAYVVCTSVDEAPSRQFMDAFTETFAYLGLHFGGAAHVNCRDGYRQSVHDRVAQAFARQVREAAAPG
jgi:multimeric flavodoxin WrbA